MRKIKSTTTVGHEVAKHIREHTLTFHFPDKLKGAENTGVDSLPYQLEVGMAPNIANALYNRDKEVVENERLKTITTLARTLNDKQFMKAITALGYSITIEEKK